MPQPGGRLHDLGPFRYDAEQRLLFRAGAWEVKPVTAPARNVLFWTPRIVCILFAAFVSLFALDVFGQGQPVWRQILAFLIHLIPVYVLVIVLAVTWRWEWVGGVVFPALGIYYIYMTRGRFPLATYLVMSGLPILLGGLFLAGWFLRARIRSRS